MPVYPGFHNKEELKGKFELANKGTLFLNEISEIPISIQTKLLDAIENKRIWPLGKQEPISIDVRIIVATNKKLEEEVKKGNFRSDLYSRINLLSIDIAPLRERKEDIPVLAAYFIFLLRLKYSHKVERITPQTLEELLAHDWTGNVRELKHALEKAIILSDRSTLSPNLFRLKNTANNEIRSLAEVEKEHILAVLKHTKGNKQKTSDILGISKGTLYNKLKGYGIKETEK